MLKVEGQRNAVFSLLSQGCASEKSGKSAIRRMAFWQLDRLISLTFFFRPGQLCLGWEETSPACKAVARRGAGRMSETCYIACDSAMLVTIAEKGILYAV